MPCPRLIKSESEVIFAIGTNRQRNVRWNSTDVSCRTDIAIGAQAQCHSPKHCGHHAKWPKDQKPDLAKRSGQSQNAKMAKKNCCAKAKRTPSHGLAYRKMRRKAQTHAHLSSSINTFARARFFSLAGMVSIRFCPVNSSLGPYDNQIAASSYEFDTKSCACNITGNAMDEGRRK